MSKNWVFTVNNPIETDLDIPLMWEGVEFLVYQLERGEAGTYHWQGYVIWKVRKGLAGCKRVCRVAHWEVRRGTHEEAVSYSSKEDTRQEGPWYVNEGYVPAGQGARNDLKALKSDLDAGMGMREVADKYFGDFLRYGRGIKEYQILKRPTNREWVTWTTVLYGPSGSGKSRRAQREAGPEAYYLSKPGRGQQVFWDGYDGHAHVVLDDFDDTWAPRNYWVRVFDRYPLLVHTKGGMTPFLAKKIWITTNRSPWTEWYAKSGGIMELDRRLRAPHGEVVFVNFEEEQEVEGGDVRRDGEEQEGGPGAQAGGKRAAPQGHCDENLDGFDSDVECGGYHLAEAARRQGARGGYQDVRGDEVDDFEDEGAEHDAPEEEAAPQGHIGHYEFQECEEVQADASSQMSGSNYQGDGM